ncbi:MAG: N-acetylmuramoyl-L-alanine amidase [Lepagella sp.]
MIILIDNGHGYNTPGKCSPDGKFKEWKKNRELARDIVMELKDDGYDARLIVTEENDISLAERVQRVNYICRKEGTSNVILVSIHSNAAGADGKWHSARGFSAHVSLNASDKSKRLAKFLWQRAIEYGLKGNRCVPQEMFIAQNLYILRHTACPAVLTENLFYDNQEDLEMLQSQQGHDKIVLAHLRAIRDYIKSL